jgi:hypothetical protein
LDGGSAQLDAAPGSVAHSAIRQYGVTAWYTVSRPAAEAGPSFRSATNSRLDSMMMTAPDAVRSACYGIGAALPSPFRETSCDAGNPTYDAAWPDRNP